jgi:hypothetical protein
MSLDGNKTPNIKMGKASRSNRVVNLAHAKQQQTPPPTTHSKTHRNNLNALRRSNPQQN